MATAWFRPKRYGYGATPANWRDWAFLLGFIAGFVLLNRLWPKTSVALAEIPMGIDVALVVVYVVVIWWKTEGVWRWRWGGE